jgi:hypothetical protein
MSFFREIRRPEGLIAFRSTLSEFSDHHQHIILCFMSGQMRWCFLSSARRLCPHCSAPRHWQHFFSCPHLLHILTSRDLSLRNLRCNIRESRWRAVFSCIAHVLIVWSFSINSDPNLTLSYDVDGFRSLLQLCVSVPWMLLWRACRYRKMFSWL